MKFRKALVKGLNVHRSSWLAAVSWKCRKLSPGRLQPTIATNKSICNVTRENYVARGNYVDEGLAREPSNLRNKSANKCYFCTASILFGARAFVPAAAMSASNA
jgi:hypothetical protein